jgi:signal transduction histidine kinase
MARSFDRLSLVAGLGLIATGALLLAAVEEQIDLSLGLFGAVVAVFLAGTGAALLWSRSPSEVAAPTTSEILTAPSESLPPVERDRLRDLYRGGFGAALIAGAALIVLSRTGALDSAGDAILTILVAILALALVLAPFWWRLGKNLAAERAERIRSQERAEMAAHIHDSVLQTLTLVQKRADDPRAVAQLARAQEREIRGWLFSGERAPASASLAVALEEASAEVEDAHRVPIDVVAVGDGPVGEPGATLVAAAREAMVNAAKFAPEAGEIAVYAELSPERAEVFVRDRGDGFDPATVPADRRGVKESIIGRMERSGGTARIRSGAGGTEVELAITLDGAAPRGNVPQ